MMSLLLLAAGNDAPMDEEDAEDAVEQPSVRGRGGTAAARQEARKMRAKAISEQQREARPKAARGGRTGVIGRPRKRPVQPHDEIHLTSTSVIHNPLEASIYSSLQASLGLLGAGFSNPAAFLAQAQMGIHPNMFGAMAQQPTISGDCNNHSMEHQSRSAIEDLARKRAAVVAAENLEAKALADQQLTSQFLCHMLSQRSAAMQQAQHMSHQRSSTLLIIHLIFRQKLHILSKH